MSEGSHDRSSQEACSCGVEGEPAPEGSPPVEVALGQRVASEGGDHEAEVAGVGGRSDSGGGHDGGDVGWEDVGFLEEAGREAEEGSDGGGGRSNELVVVAGVEAVGDEGEERGGEEEAGEPRE